MTTTKANVPGKPWSDKPTVMKTATAGYPSWEPAPVTAAYVLCTGACREQTPKEHDAND
jgi:hypothetical protein